MARRRDAAPSAFKTSPHLLLPQGHPWHLAVNNALTIGDAVDLRFLLGGVGLLPAERTYGESTFTLPGNRNIDPPLAGIEFLNGERLNGVRPIGFNLAHRQEIIKILTLSYSDVNIRGEGLGKGGDGTG